MNENLALTARNDLVEVIADFSRAIEIAPHNASALNWRGLMYLMIGDLEHAFDDFRNCVDHEPLYTPCVTNPMQISRRR